MNQDKFIQNILKMETEGERKYTFMLCLRSARNLVGSNLETGKCEYNNIYNIEKGLYHSHMFTGLINYLIFLEIIGTIFKPKGRREEKQKNGIYKSLYYFSDLTIKEITVVRSLRNAFAHNFGLAIKNDEDNKFTHKFTLSFEGDVDDIVSIPVEKWNGHFDDKRESSFTKIYVYNLIKLIEKVYQNIITCAEKNELEISLTGGEKELNTRFSIV